METGESLEQMTDRLARNLCSADMAEVPAWIPDCMLTPALAWKRAADAIADLDPSLLREVFRDDRGLTPMRVTDLALAYIARLQLRRERDAAGVSSQELEGD